MDETQRTLQSLDLMTFQTNLGQKEKKRKLNSLAPPATSTRFTIHGPEKWNSPNTAAKSASVST